MVREFVKTYFFVREFVKMKNYVREFVNRPPPGGASSYQSSDYNFSTFNKGAHMVGM